MKVVFKYSKKGKMKFISHLDMVRLFSRVFFRSDYKIKYTEGFNPHPKMNFAFPISLGLESTGEYMEAEFTDDYPLNQIKEDINAILPEGIQISEVFISKTQKSLTSEIKNVIYEIDIISVSKVDSESLKSKIAHFREYNYKVIREKTKKNKVILKQIHINEYINSIKILDCSQNKMILEVYVRYDNSGTLKPDEISKFIFDRIIDYSSINIIRKDIEFY